VADYRIDSERAAFDVTTRPGVPGLGARVSGVQGSFRVTIDDDGAVDLTQPVAGAFSLTVGDLRTGNQWVTARIPWLGSSDRALMRGSITHARRTRDTERDGKLELPLTIEVADRAVKLVGSGRLLVRPSGDLEAVGGTLCDPRSFGIPLPPLVNLTVFVRWRLFLEPFPDGVDPALDALLADAED
jgi:hypothetical protein